MTKRSDYYIYTVLFLVLNFIYPSTGFTSYLQRESEPDSLLSEAPHIFIQDSASFKLVWVEAGVRREATDSKNDKSTAAHLLGFSPYAHFQYLQTEEYGQQSEFNGIKRFLAISDIHGNDSTYRHFLRSHGVIDSKDNWIYGDGHLIVLGDILDRGDAVTEALWLTFKLEEQALRLGGRVHFLAGNHESMVLYNDVRYVNPKYVKAADIMGVEFKKWFGHSSILGVWLRKRPIMITINDNLFVHAGVSNAILQNSYSKDEINSSFRNKLFTVDSLIRIDDQRLDLLRFTDGPLWYRGYFKKDRNPLAEIDSALQYYGTERMIIGHTPGDRVRTLQQGKVIAIDSYLQGGNKGEILLYDNGKFFRGFSDGSRLELH